MKRRPTWVEQHSGSDETHLDVAECELVQRISKLELVDKQLSEWHLVHEVTAIQYNTIQYSTKLVKRHVAVASEALANRTVKKHRRRRTNVL